MSKKLTAAIQESYVTAAKLQAIYDERFTVTTERVDGERQRRYQAVLDMLEPVVMALPWTPRSAILTAARETATQARANTRAQLERRERSCWRMG